MLGRTLGIGLLMVGMTACSTVQNKKTEHYEASRILPIDGDRYSEFIVCNGIQCAERAPTPKTRKSVSTTPVLAEKVPERVSAPEPIKQQEDIKVNESLNIFMPLGKASVSENDITALDDFIRLSLEQGKRHFVVSGYTDHSGSAAVNRRLSKKRAQMVARLIKKKYKNIKISIKTYPQCCNNKGQSEQSNTQNRRVQIDSF